MELSGANVETAQHRKMAGLVLHLCKLLCFTRKVVVFNSGFCILQALVELKKLGVYVYAIIKKRCY